MHYFCNPFQAKTLFFCLFFICATRYANAAAELNSGRVREIASFLPSHAVGVGQPATNRKAWNELAALPVYQNWLNGSRQSLLEPLPKVTDDLFLDFSHSGNREPWQNIEFPRRKRMASLALAECLEDKGAFLAPLEKAIKEICTERTWVYPAHDRNLDNFYGKTNNIDLGSSWVAWELGTIDFLLADKLSASTRKLIRDNLQHRIFQPYRDMAEGRRSEDSWMRRSNNWNAVCLAGVTGAALSVLDSPKERAWYIASAQFYIRNFLNGFTSDGYCSEGVSYWNYGFGHFIMLTEAVRQATSGHVDFLADPTTHNPAMFGRKIEILNGIYPSIADCHPTSQPDPAFDAYICRRLNVKPCAVGGTMFRSVTSKLFATVLFSFLPDDLPHIASKATVAESPLRSWFPEGGVLICRPDATAKIPFAVSLKGGHNGESHNHNDLGSFIVLVGRSTVVTDPGAEIYTRETFSTNRYKSDVLNSFGHDVPVVAGKLQRAGPGAKARVLRSEFTQAKDILSLDLKSAYAVPTLQRLERTFVFQRDKLALSVHDDVEFSTPESYETALITWGEWKQLSTNEFSITDDKGAARVKIDTGGRSYAINLKPLNAKVATLKKATHIGIVLQEPVTNASVVLTITPLIVGK
ncbi:MAG: heparinase II/III family protein [Verrucomicrobiota bacterium]